MGFSVEQAGTAGTFRILGPIATIRDAADFAENQFRGDWVRVFDNDDSLSYSEYIHVDVDQEELEANGYIEIVEQNGFGGVVLRTDEGGLELFAVRANYAGWCLETTCGRVLEFCASA